MIRTIIKGTMAGALGLVATAMPGVAAPASAAYSFEWDEAALASPTGTMVCTNNVDAYACVQADGDKIWVYDNSPDGASAVARWYTDYGRWGTCRNAHGAGTYAVCNKDFKEGHTFYWRTSLCDAEIQDYVGVESDLDSVGPS